MMPQNYDFVWRELNQRLQEIEKSSGLDGVFRELEAFHVGSGFIKDQFEEISRYTFYHPEDKSHFFRVQHNQKRALRLKGSGIKVPPPGIVVQNNGCFLCRDNVAWQQQGNEIGYEIQVDGDSYYAWMNPFPLLPTHVVISTREHTSQEWTLHDDGQLDTTHMLHCLVGLASRLPGYIGFYNGVGAGASIPGHMHLHFCRRPEDAPSFPLEQMGRELSSVNGEVMIVKDYPLAVAVWRGSSQEVVQQAAEWISHWAEGNCKRLNSLAANFIATSDPATSEVTLYFTPRERNRSWRGGMSDLIGGLEVLGEFVYTIEEEQELLEEGVVEYFALEKILADIHTSFFPDKDDARTESGQIPIPT
jgi:diadenosine tetraphosphate (Ap4A) HIT family hydrolase